MNGLLVFNFYDGIARIYVRKLVDARTGDATKSAQANGEQYQMFLPVGPVLK